MHKSKFTFIRYSNCWEDTHVLLAALNIQSGETGISVASAGDNTFAMLLKHPKRIYAFDVNETQLFCCELKMQAFRYLEYEEMLTLLGVCTGNRISLYRKISCYLSYQAKKYFDAHTELIESGIIHVGKFERYFRIFRNAMIPLVATKERFRCFVKIKDMERQKQFFRQYINTHRLHLLFRIYFGYRVMGKLGRDSSFYRYVEDKESSGTDIQKRFEYGISHTLNAENPYINYIVLGRYTKRSLPIYLRKENFETIRENLDKLILVHSDLMSLHVKEIDFANLSDIFEYMSADEFRQNEKALRNMMRPNGRIAYWNMQNRRYLNDHQFRYDAETSEQLFEVNQSWFYRDFRLYRRKTCNE